MSRRRIIDISQALSPDLPVWPGDTPFSQDQVWSLGPGSPVNVARFRLSTHAGAHADAPLHYDPDGAPIGAVSLDPYIGPCRVLDARAWGPTITPDRVAPCLASPVERVLFRTWDRFPRSHWASGFTVIAADTIRLLADKGVVLIGVDAPSLDPETSKTMDAHLAVKAADMRILEGLVLDAVEAGDYELIALPLPLRDLDAAPVRAVLRTWT